MSAQFSGLRERFPGGGGSAVRGAAGRAGVAQLVEHLICNQRVGGSNPFASSTNETVRRFRGGPRKAHRNGKEDFTGGRRLRAGPVFRGVPTSGAGSEMPEASGRRALRRSGINCDEWVMFPASGIKSLGGCAQVAEWLMAADCKSAAPCELRRFESSPVHHESEGF